MSVFSGTHNLVLPPEFHVLERDDRNLIIDPVNHVWFVTDELGRHCIDAYSKRLDPNDALTTFRERTNSRDTGSGKKYVEELLDGLCAIGFLHEEYYERVSLPSQAAAYPSVIYLHLTASCNLKCSYCYNQEHRLGLTEVAKTQKTSLPINGNKTTENFLKVLTEASALGISQLKLTGGEATLNKDFIRIAAHAKELGMRVNLLSNGGMIGEKNAKAIVEAVDVVSISIDSKDPDGGHDAIRGNGSHQRAMDAIRHLRAAGLETLHINGVVTPTTLNSVEELLDHARGALNAQRVTLAGSLIDVRDSENRWGAKEQLLSEHDYRKLIETEYEYYKSRGEIAGAHFTNQCGVGNHVVSVDPNGDIYPCQTLHERPFIMGNAFSDGLKAVLDNHSVRDQTRLATVDKIPECNVCPVRYICASGCRAEAYTREGDFLARNTAMCPTYYVTATNKLWDSVGTAN